MKGGIPVPSKQPRPSRPRPLLYVPLPSPPGEEGSWSKAWAPRSYPLGEVEGSDAKWPEAAEHGEDGEAQVVPGGQREEVVFTVTVCGGGITLQNRSGFETRPRLTQWQ